MRYVILGAGAVGATIGGRLAEADCQTVLVGRGAHAAAVKRDGLLLVRPDRSVRLRVPMLTMDELALGAQDVLILAVKSQDTAGLLAQLAAGPAAGDGVAGLPVFCAQNGLANEDTALRYFERVYGVCVNIPATHLEAGVVEAAGTPVSGVLQIGRYPAGADDTARAVAADLDRAGIRAHVRTDVMAYKRAKLLSNLANALQVLVGGGPGSAAQSDGAIGTVVARIRAEGDSCFAAAGWSVVDRDQFRAVAYGFTIAALGGRSRQGGSTWQSVERGLPSVETDFLNGEIVRLGRLHGVPTPVNAAIQAGMHDIVRRARVPGSLDPAALLA